MLTLHCFGESGHSYKAALTLAAAGLDWSPVFVDFFAGETRSEAYRRNVNEMGEAPVLTDTATGARLSQSGVIQLHLAERGGQFGGSTDGERAEILRWILWDNHKLSSVAGTARFLMNFLPEDKRSQPVIDFHIARLRASLGILDGHLAGRDWIAGPAPSIADFTCCGYLFYDEPFGFDRAAWPAISAWLDRIAALPGWAHPYDLMPPAHPVNRKGPSR